VQQHLRYTTSSASHTHALRHVREEGYAMRRRVKQQKGDREPTEDVVWAAKQKKKGGQAGRAFVNEHCADICPCVMP
jgi:hypothetical protein